MESSLRRLLLLVTVVSLAATRVTSSTVKEEVSREAALGKSILGEVKAAQENVKKLVSETATADLAVETARVGQNEGTIRAAEEAFWLKRVEATEAKSAFTNRLENAQKKLDQHLNRIEGSIRRYVSGFAMRATADVLQAQAALVAEFETLKVTLTAAPPKHTHAPPVNHIHTDDNAHTPPLIQASHVASFKTLQLDLHSVASQFRTTTRVPLEYWRLKSEHDAKWDGAEKTALAEAIQALEVDAAGGAAGMEVYSSYLFLFIFMLFGTMYSIELNSKIASPIKARK